MRRQLFAALAVTLLVQSAILVQSAHLPACGLAESTKIASSASIVASSPNAIDGTGMLQSVLDRCQDLKSYAFESALTTYSNGKTIKESGRFFFKSPNLVRFEVTASSGPRNGAVVVRQPDGAVRVKTGGLFGGLKLTLSKDSNLIRTSNGFSIVESDFGSLLKFARKKLGQLKCVATQAPCAYSGNENAYIIELIEPDGDVAERIALDPKDKLPIEWSIFSNKALFSDVKFNNTRINPSGVTEETFSLDKGGNESKSLEDMVAEHCDALQALKKSEGKREVTVPVMHEVERILSELRKNVQALRDLQSTSAGDTTGNTSGATAATTNMTPDEGKEVLTIAVQIDNLVDILTPVCEGLAVLDSTSPIASKAMSQDWKESLDAMTQSTARLLEKLDGSPTNKAFCGEESDKIDAQIKRLTRVSAQALKVI